MNKFLSVVVAAGMFTAMAAHAQTPAPATAPAGTTALCKDGSSFSGATKKGACSGHKGVKTWYGAAGAPAAGASAPAAAAAAPASSAAPAAATTTKTATPAASTKAAAPGGGPGQVWVNTSTKVYHCQGDKYYGKTKAGSYMSEADAKTKGFHADHGKACS
ncbi:hypothetical protein BWP39_09365 [Paraburkholderia acidicola]|uniref:DUF3761 domain-containing protein n=1 Tax=Paraburkholderia acidicola TaxID=1912599 RepID=A0A2A4F1Z2_9BURK|nr:DUF3761 domain-containing protein [Paraburkholderia acidicola]PCE26987.1 hypothetical protein BWP39_09365 [Paraburkholderia acidicola]